MSNLQRHMLLKSKYRLQQDLKQLTLILDDPDLTELLKKAELKAEERAELKQLHMVELSQKSAAVRKLRKGKQAKLSEAGVKGCKAKRAEAGVTGRQIQRYMTKCAEKLQNDKKERTASNISSRGNDSKQYSLSNNQFNIEPTKNSVKHYSDRQLDDALSLFFLDREQYYIRFMQKQEQQYSIPCESVLYPRINKWLKSSRTSAEFRRARELVQFSQPNQFGLSTLKKQQLKEMVNEEEMFGDTVYVQLFDSYQAMKHVRETKFHMVPRSTLQFLDSKKGGEELESQAPDQINIPVALEREEEKFIQNLNISSNEYSLSDNQVSSFQNQVEEAEDESEVHDFEDITDDDSKYPNCNMKCNKLNFLSDCSYQYDSKILRKVIVKRKVRVSK